MSFGMVIADIDQRLAQLTQSNVEAQARADDWQTRINEGYLESLRDAALDELTYNNALLEELQSARNLLDAAFDKKEDSDGTGNADSGT